MEAIRSSPSRVDTALAALRSRVRRHRLGPRLVGLAAIVALVLVVDGARREADKARVAWGETATVWITTQSVSSGEALGSAVAPLEVPVGLVPADAVVSVPEPGVRAAVELGTGEIVRQTRLAGSSDGEVAARIGDGQSGLTFDVDTAVHALGDRVDIYARADGAPLTRDSVVVAVGDDRIMVAVPTRDVSRIVAELGRGGVLVALR